MPKKKENAPCLADYTGVAQLAYGFNNPKKALALVYISKGASTGDIAEACRISRQGLQGHIDSLFRGGLIEHGTDENGPYYRLTARGRLSLELMNYGKDMIEEQRQRIEQEQREILDTLEKVGDENLTERVKKILNSSKET